jgi:hypothetical protein
MNPYSGELVADLMTVPAKMREQFVEIPGELTKAAADKLAGRERAMTDISEDSELSKFAREVRAMRVVKPPTESPTGNAAQRRLRQMQRKAEKAHP